MLSRLLLTSTSVALALAATSTSRPAHADRPRFGAMMDVGVPSGASASVVFRPLRGLRLHGGAAHNVVGPGVQGGISLAPIGTWIAPTLTLEAGRFFAGDANAAVEQLAGAPSAVAPERFGYDYASAQIGLEMGPAWATFYLHAGVSYVRAQWSGDDTSEDGSVSTMTEAEVRAVGVSARLGFIFYFAR